MNTSIKFWKNLEGKKQQNLFKLGMQSLSFFFLFEFLFHLIHF